MEKKIYERKFEYWHLVTKVSKEYKKDHPENQVKVGVIMSHYCKRNGSLCIIDIDKKKEWKSAYTFKYLGRLPKSLTDKEKIKILKAWKEEDKTEQESSQ